MYEIYKKVKFIVIDNLNRTFPKETFDLISARHTIINAKQIYDCLSSDGTVIISGVDKTDCWNKESEEEYLTEIQVPVKKEIIMPKICFS